MIYRSTCLPEPYLSEADVPVLQTRTEQISGRYRPERSTECWPFLAPRGPSSFGLVIRSTVLSALPPWSSHRAYQRFHRRRKSATLHMQADHSPAHCTRARTSNGECIRSQFSATTTGRARVHPNARSHIHLVPLADRSSGRRDRSQQLIPTTFSGHRSLKV